MQVAFLGLGLIGGSVARALRDAGGERDHIVAWTPSGSGPRLALDEGTIDVVASTPETALDGAELVVLAAPPLACAALLGRLGSDLEAHLAPGATITDVASTKAALLSAARTAGVPYVGGHPMAGRETSGFGAADASLFRDRPWVVTESIGGGEAATVRWLAERCGARVIEMSAADHDRLVAAVSHLPLLASVALVEAIAGIGGGDATRDWPEARSLAAGGWRDTTRLARGDATMGAEIAATNSDEIAARLRAFRDRIDEWLALLEAPGGADPVLIRERLAEAARRLDA